MSSFHHVMARGIERQLLFRRRHRRSGHLFQNRYKSIVCEEEPSLLELVRYLHLNPLRAGVVSDLEELGRYAYSGHAVLLGTRRHPWQATDEILGRFGADLRRARQCYLAFMAEGVGQYACLTLPLPSEWRACQGNRSKSPYAASIG